MDEIYRQRIEELERKVASLEEDMAEETLPFMRYAKHFMHQHVRIRTKTDWIEGFIAFLEGGTLRIIKEDISYLVPLAMIQFIVIKNKTIDI